MELLLESCTGKIVRFLQNKNVIQINDIVYNVLKYCLELDHRSLLQVKNSQSYKSPFVTVASRITFVSFEVNRATGFCPLKAHQSYV